MSLGCPSDDEEFDKALYNFYVNNKVKYLKRKLSSAGRRNVFKARVDNFLILCVCRYLFNEAHPSISKKHFFFSYIVETILNGSNQECVANAFNSANSAFPMWRSNMVV
ncbi:uncharacterized protein LOC119293872 [Triticum dicoccoides]|uniref:uncharacterized protein LOC119293872 n=1 Tax=Triticum dicoccoides TaxID=85692 RepID=UPI00188E87CA|nr:uncharacterized protein LOC119293872 [Triticum dicoccoides]